MSESGIYTIQSVISGTPRTWLTLRSKNGPVTAEEWTGADNQKWIVKHTAGVYCTIENLRWAAESEAYTYSDPELGSELRGEDYATTWATVEAFDGKHGRKWMIKIELETSTWSLENNHIYMRDNDLEDERQLFDFRPVE